MKPYVICPMCTTIDGRVVSRRAAAPLGHVTGCRVGMKVSDSGRRGHEHLELRPPIETTFSAWTTMSTSEAAKSSWQG